MHIINYIALYFLKKTKKKNFKIEIFVNIPNYLLLFYILNKYLK